jgi:DNA-binding GntR family transcriptional regulator
MSASHRPSKDAVAYRDIKKLLFQRRLPPGQKIIYRDLEEALGMSKTPIICALARLEKEGLVVSRQNRGFYVRELATRELQQMYDLRMRLEEIAIDYALESGPPSPKNLERLEAALHAYVSYNARVYDARRFKLDAEFHTAIAHLGGNSFLVAVLEQFYLSAWVSVNVVVFTPFIDRFRADHQALFRAIEKGDRKEAKSLMRRHERAAMDAVAVASNDRVEMDYFSNL